MLFLYCCTITELNTLRADTIAMPNYTGSLGFGEKYIMELLGKVGRLDVGDCIASVRYLIDRGISQPGMQFLTGGSHGGFLIGHRKSYLRPLPSQRSG